MLVSLRRGAKNGSKGRSLWALVPKRRCNIRKQNKKWDKFAGPLAQGVLDLVSNGAESASPSHSESYALTLSISSVSF